jgi:hypothetical protein
VATAIAREEAHERAEARRAEIERADEAEKRHESAVAAYKAAAESRGEVVSALAIARGEVGGRDIGDVLRDAIAASDRQDAMQAARERRESGDWEYVDTRPEPVLPGRVSRSDGWPGSEYELGSLIERASELHRWGVAYQARLASRRGQDPAAAVRGRNVARSRDVTAREYGSSAVASG